MFVMKKIILAAVFIVTISGVAAAQSTSAKPEIKKTQTAVKKGSTAKPSTKNMVLKQEASASAKSETAVKLELPASQAIADSTAMPKVKNKDF